MKEDKKLTSKKLRIWFWMDVVKFLLVVIALFTLVAIIQSGGSPVKTITIIICLGGYIYSLYLTDEWIKRAEKKAADEKTRKELLTRLASTLRVEVDRWNY